MDTFSAWRLCTAILERDLCSSEFPSRGKLIILVCYLALDNPAHEFSAFFPQCQITLADLQYQEFMIGLLFKLTRDLLGSAVKKPPAIHETQVRSLGQEDPQEGGLETHSSTLA